MSWHYYCLKRKMMFLMTLEAHEPIKYHCCTPTHIILTTSMLYLHHVWHRDFFLCVFLFRYSMVRNLLMWKIKKFILSLLRVETEEETEYFDSWKNLSVSQKETVFHWQVLYLMAARLTTRRFFFQFS